MTADSEGLTTDWTRRQFLQGVAGGVAGIPSWLQDVPRVQAAPTQKNQPSGQMTWAVHVTLAPTWFDPAETSAMIPYMFLYVIHDALIKPMPGDPQCPSLATHWTESEDGLAYTFDLRQGLTFHNGDPFTAEDVRYSFERYHGTGAALLRAKVEQVVVSHPYQVRFQLHDPWPHFLTFYGGLATGTGWIFPQRYTEAVGNEKFTERPIGLGPYCVAQHTPGVELVLEAFPHYWRKMPAVKCLVFKSIPEPTTRLAMLKNREVDVAHALYGPLAAAVQHDPSLKLEPVRLPGTGWIVFIDMYQPQSPWRDRRVRLAANHAINKHAINDAEMLGYSVVTGGIIPQAFDYALTLEPYAYDSQKARQLLHEAGYATGFDAGACTCDAVYARVVEAAVNVLAAVGIRAHVRAMERAAIFAAQRGKMVKNLTLQTSSTFGSAATRIEAFLYSQSPLAYLNDPEIDTWYERQARERHRPTREALLHTIQQKVYDEAYVAPLMCELGFLCASGPRVAVSGLALIPLFAYSAPLEEVRLTS